MTTTTTPARRCEEAALNLENAYAYLSAREDADGGTDDWTDDGAGNLALRAVTGAQQLLEELDHSGIGASPAVLIAVQAFGVHPDQVTTEQIAQAEMLLDRMRHPLPRVGTILLLPGMGRVIEVCEGHALKSTTFHWKLDNTYEVLGFDVFKAEVLDRCVLLFTPEQVRKLTRTGRRVTDIVFRLRLHGDDWIATAKRWNVAGRID